MKQRWVRSLRGAGVFFFVVSNLLVGRAAALPCLSIDGGSCGITSNSLFGQQQSYDVLLRGDGEAVVNSRIDLTNNNSNSMSSLAYTVTSGKLETVTAFQQVSCADLPIVEPLGVSGTSSNTNDLAAPSGSGSASTGTTNTVPSTDIPECYQDLSKYPLNSPNELPDYYPLTDYVYKNITVKQSGNSFTLSLPQAISMSGSSTIVMSYSLAGVSHKHLGVYDYSFKTLQSASAVSQATVALSVDQNYDLAGAANSNINYKPVAGSALGSNIKSGTAQALDSTSSSDISSYVDSIGTNGSITKQASSLSALETFTVSGRFATSKFLLAWEHLAAWGVVLLVILILLVVWYRRNRKKQQTKQSVMQGEKEMPTNPNSKAEVSTESRPTVTTATDRKAVTINLSAIPFYGVASTIKHHFQERRVRPLFFAWLCGILSVGLLAAFSFGWSQLTNLNNTYSPTSSSTVLINGLYIGLIGVGILGSLYFAVGLPIVYAGNLRRAMRIFLHMLVFFAVVILVLATLAIRANDGNSNNCNANAACGGFCNTSAVIGGGACINPGGLDQSSGAGAVSN